MNMKKNKFIHQNFLKPKNLGGFTLVEMLVAVGLFAVVSVIALSAFISLTTASRYAQGTRALSDSTGFIFEDIVRTMQTGSEYRFSGNELILTISNDLEGSTSVETVIYRLGDGVDDENDDEGVVYKIVNSNDPVPLNDKNRIKIETLEFNVYEPGSLQSIKKRVALVLEGVFVGPNNETQPISLYTTVYQRI